MYQVGIVGYAAHPYLQASTLHIIHISIIRELYIVIWKPLSHGFSYIHNQKFMQSEINERLYKLIWIFDWGDNLLYKVIGG